MRLIFMGTSEFAVPCLLALLRGPHSVVAVVTAPDKPAGRSLHLSESPVKSAAKGLGIHILQPADLRDPFFLKAMTGYQPDVAAVVAFRILPTELFTIPSLGCVNLHASLLPELRGAAPIQWALMRGFIRTGVTTFLIERKVDTGGILLQEQVPILPEDDSELLSRRMSDVGAALLTQSLAGLEAGRLTPRPQIGEPSTAPKITRETCVIDWTRSAVEIHNQVRGLAPTPAAFTHWEGKVLKLYRTEVIGEAGSLPGSIQMGESSVLTVATGQGSLVIRELQLEGKKRMRGEEFTRGRQIRPGTRLGGE